MEPFEQVTGTRLAAPADTIEAIDEVDLIPVQTYWELVRQRFVQHRLAVVAAFLMAVLLLMAIVVPTLTGDAYKATSLTRTMQPPFQNLAHVLGTNQIGQDMFLRTAKAM